MELLNSFLARVTKYEWLNRLLPGVFFVLMARVLKCPMFSPENWLEAVGAYILWGELSSRVGALVIEPLLRFANIVKFAEYDDYQDYQKINKGCSDMLIANANFARTLCALGIMLLVMRVVRLVQNCNHVSCVSFGWKDLAIIIWVMLFLFAYCRQVNFLVKRIDKFKKDTHK